MTKSLHDAYILNLPYLGMETPQRECQREWMSPLNLPYLGMETHHQILNIEVFHASIFLI